MALQLGTENKKQVRIVLVLFSLLAVVAVWRIYQMLSGPSAPSRPIPPPPTATAQSTPAPATQNAPTEPAAKKVSGAAIDPTLHFELLAQSESVSYQGSGRNIFAGLGENTALPQVKIEKPLKSVRPSQQVATPVPLGPPPPPRPPSIDLKYFGYTLSSNKTLQAFLMHGEDIFIARTGEIINHRYKVGTIRPNSVEITDLPYNNTEVRPLQAH
jgi:hypothetical protein